MMHWPQMVVIIAFAADFGLMLAQNGQPKTGKHSLLTTVIAITGWSVVLYFGGFWK